jgi:hypothetical protein
MSSNPLANRLTQQRNRIAGMLTPGAKTAPGGLPALPLSPILAGIGGQKYLQAARKMRILDPQRLGSLQPQNILRPLTGPAIDTTGLLHIKPAAEDQPNPWSQLETIFPSAAASEPAPAAPAAGELRAGSIIPRMPTFPKPGQSIESFKEQVQQRPKAPPPPAESPSRPRIAPNARLFSRVQEISAKKTDEDLPDLPETIQRQPYLEQPPAPQKPVDVENSTRVVEPQPVSALPPAPNVPEPETPRILPPAPRPETPAPANPPAESKTAATLEAPRTAPTPLAAAAKAPGNLPTPPAPLKTAIPAPQTANSAPTAMPRASVPPRAERTAKTAQPDAKPAARPGLTPTRAASQPANIIQRASEPPTAAPQPAPAPQKTAPLAIPNSRAETPGPIPVSQPPAPEEPAPARASIEQPDDAPQPAAPATVANAPQPEEMPLRQQAIYRKESAARLAKSADVTARPVLLPPSTLARAEKPLIAPQKYRPAASSPQVVARQPDEPQARVFSQPAPGRDEQTDFQLAKPPQEQNLAPAASQTPSFPAPAAAFPTEMALPPVNMALAMPPAASNLKAASSQPATTQPTEAPPVTPAPQTSTPPAQAQVQIPSANAQVRNVIQRMWPEHQGISGNQDGQGSGGPGSQEESQGAAIDLEQLAEDVLPYIKRLIEIESDRIAGRFR